MVRLHDIGDVTVIQFRATGHSEFELRTTTWAISRLLGDVAGLGSINGLIAIDFRIVGQPETESRNLSLTFQNQVFLETSVGEFR